MKLIDLTCPHCNAQLTVDDSRQFIFCEYCGAKILIDDEVKHIQFDNTEEAGYNFERGRQRAKAEATREILFDRRLSAEEEGYRYEMGRQRAQAEAARRFPTPVYQAPVQMPAVSRKSRGTALVIWLFFGLFGGHYFYAGRPGTGFLYLFTMGIFGLGWFKDFFVIIFGGFKDGKGLPIK